jgi:hypothetical protein
MVRIVLKRPFPDGTVTVEMDPLSLLCRLAASVPPPRHHRQVRRRARGASEWRSRIVPPSDDALAPERPGKKKRRRRYRTWAELLARTFGLDSLACPVCRGRMRLVAVLRNPARIARYLASIGEPTELPKRSPKQGPAVLEEPRPAPDGHRPRRRRLSGSDPVHHLTHPGPPLQARAKVCLSARLSRRAVPWEALQDPLRDGSRARDVLPKAPPAAGVGDRTMLVLPMRLARECSRWTPASWSRVTAGTTESTPDSGRGLAGR